MHKTNENNQPPMILVGNKKDLEKERKISNYEAKNMAQEWGIEYIETSAKNTYVLFFFFNRRSDVL